MKNAFLDTVRDSAGTWRRWARRRWPTAVFAAAACLPAAELLAQAAPPVDQFAPRGAPMLAPPPAPLDGPPLPPQVVMMPRATEDLEVVHRRSQLLVTRSSIVRTAIADPSVIDLIQFTGNEISIIGLGTGSTTLTLWFDGDPHPLIYEVRCIADPSLAEQRRLDYGKLERKLAILFPNSKVYLIPISGKIVVKGQAYDTEEAARILQIVRGEVINQLGTLAGPQPAPINAAVPGQSLTPFDMTSSYIVNMLEVPGEYQVMVRVRIAEIDRAQLRQKGINLAGLFNSGATALASGLGGFPSTLTGIFENGEISFALNWLAHNGTIKVLAEPTLTVLSGRPASFISGQEFPVPTIVGINGVGGQQTSFRGAGTSLIVTPTVIDHDMIRLEIVPEFSQINAGIGNGGVAGTDVRRVTTTVQLREGQTIAIAGLIHNQSSVQVARVPWLGDLPLAGWLFSSKQANQDESELLILVTPELVRPMDAEEVPPVPGYYVTHPGDKEFYEKGVTEGYPELDPYQVPSLGTGANFGIPVPYYQYNPAPAEPLYSPVPTNPYGASLPPQPLPPRPQPLMPAAPPSYVPAPAPYNIVPAPAPVAPEVPVPQRTLQGSAIDRPTAAPPLESTSPQPPVSPVGAGWSTAPANLSQEGASLWSGPIQQLGHTERSRPRNPAAPRKRSF